VRAIIPALNVFMLATAVPRRIFDGEDDGRMTIAVIAQHYLKPAIRTHRDAPAADSDPLTKHDFAS